ncbi:response regulator [Myxococcota bacterium]|nr:response regulator [Myxococcota bacterium]MBU1382368.1 response regulator [Myxococcota bacterium]MBU1498705.1 response regulator [Myxococcota bacterium]
MDTTHDKLKVYVVDDEPGICLGIGAILRDFTFKDKASLTPVEFEIFMYNDGESMLSSLETSVPDILLLDCKLPGISGLEMLEGPLGGRTDILTIMITAYATIETAIRATKLGAYDFLAKPFTPDELRYTIRKAVTHIMLTRQARKLEEEKRKIRFEFISILAHELKSPINAVDGYLDLMQNRILGDDLSSYIDIIKKSSDRIDGMRKMIGDLLDLTRIESGQKKRVVEETDLIDLVKNSVESNTLAAQSRNISFDLEIPEKLIIPADTGEMQIILNNLVSNAVKYNRDSGRVKICIAWDESDKLLISVQDTGIGMTAEESARLFNEFTRIKNAKTRLIPGSGLGLSIVKKIAMLYGGDVSCESEPDRGSTFRVKLDVVKVQ